MHRGPAAPPAVRARQSWQVVLLLFSATSLVEGVGVSQIFAFLPLYLRELGAAPGSVDQLVGVLSSLVFVLGLPLVPLWGVWADKYSRKIVIVRSALVEALVFALVALSSRPWHLAGSLLLVGFQLGNTGVMLSALRDVVPARRLGTAIGTFGATGSIGFAAGPAIGGLMVDGLGTDLRAVFWSSCLLSVGAALLLTFAFREVRPERIPEGRTWTLAMAAVRGVLTERATLRLFSIFGVAFLARFMAAPYLPLLVERLHGTGPGVAGAVALVTGTAALAGALVSPLGGVVGDRLGFRPVLVASLLAGGAQLAVMPLVPGVGWLALVSMGFSAASAAVSAMVFALLSVEAPPERRSATLNLVYLPLYLTGTVGPALGALVVSAGLPAVFFAAAALSVLATALRRPAGAVAT